MASNYEKQIYNQLEKALNKIDKLIDNNTRQNETIKELNKTIKNQGELIEKIMLENERLKNQINKDSNNSGKPSSTNGTTPKKSGANLYNGRTKSGKSLGGQKGHKGSTNQKLKIEQLISAGKVIVKNITHQLKGQDGKEIVKYRIGIEIIPYVEKHIFKCNSKSKEKLPKEFYTDVTYHSSIKSLCIELGIYNVISYERMSDFLNVISKGIIDVSNGTCVNFLREFSNLSKKTIKDLETDIKNQNLIYTDETGAKFNKRNIHFRNYSNEFLSIFKARLKKGHDSIKEDGILNDYTGGIMGDHDTVLYSYGTKNYECNVHLLRYFRELIGNTPYVSWPFKMYELFNRMNNTRNIAIAYKVNKFEKSKIAEYENEYETILNIAKSENSKIKSTFYKDKALKLYRRLKKYKSNHLYFIHNFEVPYSNNLSERDLRVLKIKTKVSGGFRSFEIAQCYANALTIIKTAKKRNVNPFDAIVSIFNKSKLFT